MIPLIVLLILFLSIENGSSYQTDLTKYICIEQNSTNIASCLPGYVIEIENVQIESTNDDACWGTTRCQIEDKFILSEFCFRKRICQVDLKKLNILINSTCGSTRRFFVKYRCLPVIQEQKDFICDSSSSRRNPNVDINLSCGRNSKIFIKTATVGLSVRENDEKIKCNKDVQTTCSTDVSDIYRQICQNSFQNGNEDQCKIRSNERPTLENCFAGKTSNFSMVEYFCVPTDRITEDLPRLDLCSNEMPERLRIDRALLHVQHQTEQNRFCRKLFFVEQFSRVRIFLLRSKISFVDSLQIRLFNQIRTLNLNEMIDVNVTKQETMLVEWRSQASEPGSFLVYFQIDSPTSEGEIQFSHLRKKSNDSQHRDLVILIVSIVIFLLLLVLISVGLVYFRILRRRREKRSNRFLSPTDDQRRHLTNSSAIVLSSNIGPSILTRPHNDDNCDKRSLIQRSSPNSGKNEIDNLYEEIKEQQQQTALALRKSSLNKGETFNPYLEAESIDERKLLVQDPPEINGALRDHNEVEKHYQQPREI